MPRHDDSLLIYAPVPVFRGPDGYLLEDQACNGLRLWAENFDRVVSVHPEGVGPAPASWIPVSSSAIDPDRVKIVSVPMGYRPDQHFRHRRAVRDLFSSLIDDARFLSFAIGGLFGDWGGEACLVAARKGRSFAVWTDRVESEVARHEARSGSSLKARLRATLTHQAMARRERFLIGQATVGLFHGAETHAAYVGFARAAEIVHDIHLRAEDRIPEQALAAKRASVMDGPVRICFVGRADAMKGPDDWMQVMRGLQEAGVPFEAQWLGDGERLSEMKSTASQFGLNAQIAFPGFVRDRDTILQALREAHLFVFCHKTPESPRNLIEALMSGTPIVGYDSLFPRDLIAEHGGGILTPIHDVAALTSAVVALANDRPRLSSLFERALLDAQDLNDEAVFKHRSDLIRKHLS